MRISSILYRFSLALSALAVVAFVSSCSTKANKQKEDEAKKFITELESKWKPLYTDLQLASYKSSITGDSMDVVNSADCEKKLNTFLSDQSLFAKIKAYRDSKDIKDSLLKREIEVLYLNFASYQIDTNLLNKATDLQSKITKQFNTYRAKLNGKEITDNDIEEILSNSKNNKELQEVWESSKEIGVAVSKDVVELIKVRNEEAKKLGYKNYHDMSLKLSEEDPEDILKLFDELDNLTRDAFMKEKASMDEILAKDCKIDPKDLMPWHYQNRFFQEAPKVYKVDFDEIYSKQNIEELTKKFYTSVGMPVDEVMAKSDLYEKKGKEQHAFCNNIDREKDVRVLCNIRPNGKWMETMLHEFGHSTYELYYEKDLPWTLRAPAHTLTTEGIAEFFGSFANNPQWMLDMGIITPEKKAEINDASYKSLRLQILAFSRWAQVMYRFEKSMYENPDQDLNKLWWDLVEKYQGLKRPAGREMKADWASKIHIATVPCYYHNYLLGYLFASQLYYTLGEKVLKVNPNDVTKQSLVGRPEVGKFITEKIYAPGQKYPWNEMIQRAFGEKLTAKYFARQFVQN